jgi:O-antigen/teichoic acid export membrane protein
MNNSTITKSILSGTLWTLVQTVAIKLISFSSQIVLAWILLPEDFGKIALAFTITELSSLMQQFGLQDVLIKRGKSFKLWLPLSLALTIAVSSVSVLVAIVCGYLGGYFYDDINVFYLVLIFSLSIPFQALSLIPDTFLKINLKFKQLSLFKIIEIFSIQLGIIIFALLNFGVFSFIIPLVLTAIFRCLFLFHYTKLKLARPEFKRWNYLAYNSIQGLFFAISSKLSMQLDIIILGLISTQAVVGVYYMGMTLSVQVIAFIGVALPSILFPALMKYSDNDFDQVKQSLQKVVVYMSLIGVPFACWQAVNAKPLVQLFLSEKWIPSILFVQVLSIGMVFRLISAAWVVPLKLKGDFRGMSIITFHSLLILSVIIIPMAYYYGAYGLAIGVSMFYVINSPYLIYQGFKSYSISYHYMFFNCVKIVFFGFLSYGFTFILSENVLLFQKSNILNLFLNSMVSTVFYIGLIFVFVKQPMLELLDKVKALNNK